MILAIDLDGTLAHWVSVEGNVASGNEPFRVEMPVGEWIPGAAFAVRRLREAGHRVILHTCRATWAAGGDTRACGAFLRSGGFVPFVVSSSELERGERWRLMRDDGVVERQPYMQDVACEDVKAVGIWLGVGKPIAHVYVDDRAAVFSLDDGWDPLLDRLLG